jgi:photosystem II stability/assembly factor-like uncharacterized protein
MLMRVCAWLIVSCACSLLFAADRPIAKRQPAAESRTPTPVEDDANLHDVQFVGSRRGWAAGDHGVIWHTADAGETWSLQSSGVTCPLRSVWFLSDKVGWAAGGGTTPFTRLSYGVVLATTDGGETWKPLVAPPKTDAKAPSRSKSSARRAETSSPAPVSLPRIRKIKFFSPDEGIAVGEGTGTDPAGAYATRDGGATWQPLPGKATMGWLAADFLSPEAGILVGAFGSLALAVEGKIVIPPRFERLGMRGLYDVALGRDREGWLVGDGGLVLLTENAGIVWQAPATPLADNIRDLFDFRAVCCRGDRVWVAGHPGSVIWHSPDAGQTWRKQTTGQTMPLARLHFSSDEQGWGVGALGIILHTDDGGKTWRVLRGGGRRLALMTLFGSSPQVSLGLIAELSGDAGYRSLVAVVARDDDGEVGTNEAELADRLDEAVTSAGGSASQIGWQLPLVIPGLERDFERLLGDWNRRTENRIEEILTGALVRQLRTWRPNVLVIQQPETGNALAKLVGQVALKAIEQAADSTRFLEHEELAGLEPWQVRKVFVRLPPGSSGHVNVDPFRYLPRLRETVGIVASTAEGLIREESDLKSNREAFRLIRSQWEDGQEPTFAGGIFSGLSIPAGSAARRAMGSLDDDDLEARLKIARQQRNFAAYSERFLGDNRHAAQLIAQLPEIVRGMTAAEAAWQMTHLAEQYHAVGQWELEELTLVELVEKYPDQPAGLRAMQRLVQFWGSAEVTWRRLRTSSTEQRREQNDPESSAGAAIRLAEARLRKQERNRNRSIFDPDPDEEVGNETGGEATDDAPPSDRGTTGAGQVIRKDLERKFRFWQARALKLARELERRSAPLAADPSVQFPLAAIHRQRTAYLKSDEIYRRYLVHETGSPWSQAAEGEIWLANPLSPPTGPVTPCGFTHERPILDGVLFDACWQNAAELPLLPSKKDRREGRRPALAKLCYDAEFLYFAASVPRAKGMRTDGPVTEDRRHDEDLDEFDRILFSIDTDRDYVTAFHFAIDQRGCTSEACWNDSSWNPRWFVAAAGDKSSWRIEAAIPLDELTPVMPQRGTGWGLGITRIAPAVSVESWTQPPTATNRPENFGLLRFDAPGDPR